MHPLLRLHLLCFPPACRLCRRMMNPLARAAPGFPYLCTPCREGLPWKDPAYSCRACGVATSEPGRERCPNCAGRPQAPSVPQALSRVWCAFSYEDPLRRWVWDLKYHREETICLMLGTLLSLAPNGQAPLAELDWVIPVPLHPKRLRLRGFNQAYLLAHAWLAERKRRGEPVPPLTTGLLRRHRHTLPQIELSPAQRADNVAAAFSVNGSAVNGSAAQGSAAGNIRGSAVNGADDSGANDSGGSEAGASAKPLAGGRVLLVDDLMTTGATLAACAATLLEAGAERVEALVLARA